VIDQEALSDRARQRLKDDMAVWLVTVRADGTPQPTPVWFVWDGSTALFYSMPGKQKLRNIAANPSVALHFNADSDGEDVLVLTGRAAIDPSAPVILDNPAYLDKYAQGIKDIGETPESVSADYSQAVRVEPFSVRSW
jgi:PPOX class probable F420-dependent enzyme